MGYLRSNPDLKKGKGYNLNLFSKIFPKGKPSSGEQEGFWKMKVL